MGQAVRPLFVTDRFAFVLPGDKGQNLAVVVLSIFSSTKQFTPLRGKLQIPLRYKLLKWLRPLYLLSSSINFATESGALPSK